MTLGPAPRSGAGGARAAAALLDWGVVGALLAAGAEGTLVVRSGRLAEGPPPRSLAEARELFAAGWSLVLRGTERYDPRLRALADAFESRHGGRAVIQLYATPAGFNGFGWHYDAEHVFIAQAAGRKDYYFRANTVNPRPRIDAMPKDMRYGAETSPMHSATLLPDDWLFLPSGWWHAAKAETDSLSVSVGLLAPEQIPLAPPRR